MSTDPQPNNPDAEQSPPVEETIPLVKSDRSLDSTIDSLSAQPGEQSAGDSAAEAPRPLTPLEMDCYECRSCGYTYEPVKGDSRTEIPAGVEFRKLPQSWRCPVCGASTTQFSNVGPAGTASGFKENLNYGFGVNTLTPAQKNALIFGALGIAVLFFLSLYGLR
ncbi:MAG: rubredoxin [Phormidesmis sp.]